MSGNGSIPNYNKDVIRMLSKKFGQSNKGRNRILAGAVCLCIVTLTMVFGISFGKVKAEYLRAVRAAGTAASVEVANVSQRQYEEAATLAYVKSLGRYAPAGEAVFDGKEAGRIRVLDELAWEKMVKPAYTDIHGHYPEEEQEIMLSKQTLKDMGIHEPAAGMEIPLTVNLGLFRTEEETFRLSGWYTDYADSRTVSKTSYISQAKYKAWGYDIREKANMLICQSDNMDWREVEQRLYQDLPEDGTNIKITAGNTFTYDAVGRMAGGYGMAALGALVVLCGMFFLVHNVMHISMAGDIRQMGLLHTIGTTKKQIRSIYFGQIRSAIIPGVVLGISLSTFVLHFAIPRILGSQYLSRYGGAGGFKIFRPEILGAAAVFAVVLAAGAAAGVIYRVVNISCVESVDYTIPASNKVKVRHRPERVNYKRRSAELELWYMAWQNLTRQKGRFLLTVFSLFLGMEAFLGTIVITKGSDYMHVIEKRPDFLISGEFSEWGKEEGYGMEYKSRDAGEDPMKTEGDNFCLLYGNEYDEFEPVSTEVKEELLKLDGVDRTKSYIMEGAYMISTVSRKGIRPLEDDYNEKAAEKEGTGYSSDYAMVEGFEADIIQILSEEELNELQKYAEENKLSVDMESLQNGTGVIMLHDHLLSPEQEVMAAESVGETVYFSSLWSKEEWMAWNKMNPEERDTMEETFPRKQSESFSLCGYVDNRGEEFPEIRQTWHGAKGSIYYLISEKGFEKLPSDKKTLYMELEVEKEKEPAVKAEIQEIVIRENRRRAVEVTNMEGERGEAGIFCISKSELLSEAANYIQGNRMIFGSISAVLLSAGLMNYFNVMITGILSRKKELDIMESVGMTKRQRRKLLQAEGLYYCLVVAGLMLTAGSGILAAISFYMNEKLSYFVFGYPFGWFFLLILSLAGICAALPAAVRIS